MITVGIALFTTLIAASTSNDYNGVPRYKKVSLCVLPIVAILSAAFAAGLSR